MHRFGYKAVIPNAAFIIQHYQPSIFIKIKSSIYDFLYVAWLSFLSALAIVFSQIGWVL